MVALSDVDVMEIEQLMTRFSHALDFGDGDALAACFTADGVLDSDDGGGPHRGHDAVRQFAAAMLERGGGQLRHSILNQLVEGQGDTARATSSLVVTQAFADEADPFGRPGDATRSILKATGICLDVFVRDANGWRIARRVLRNDATPEVMARLHAPLTIGPPE